MSLWLYKDTQSFLLEAFWQTEKSRHRLGEKMKWKTPGRSLEGRALKDMCSPKKESAVLTVTGQRAILLPSSWRERRPPQEYFNKKNYAGKVTYSESIFIIKLNLKPIQ